MSTPRFEATGVSLTARMAPSRRSSMRTPLREATGVSLTARVVAFPGGRR